MLSQLLVQPPPLVQLALARHHDPARPRILDPVDIDALVGEPSLDKPHPLQHILQDTSYDYDLYGTGIAASPDPSQPTDLLSFQAAASSPAQSVSNCPTSTRSPSPLEIYPTSAIPQSCNPPHQHHHFASSANSCPPDMDRYSISNLADRYLREGDKYAHTLHPLLDHRRMSEPAMYGSTSPVYPTTHPHPTRYQHLHNDNPYPSPRSYPRSRDIHYDEPLSPLNPSFSGGEPSPTMGMPAVPYGSLHDDYGPSPPGTGTSTSSNAPTRQQHQHIPGPNSPSNSKQYSFVSLPGNAVKKRPRRRYDEIERLYQCSWPDCTKAYGTLNHLNAHVTMQKHGPKRSPNEFKELRKQWRKAKKEEAETRALNPMRPGPQHPSQHHISRDSLSDAEYQAYHLRSYSDSTRYPEHPSPSSGSLDELHDIDAHQRDVYARRQQRFSSFASADARGSSAAYNLTPHPHGIDIPTNRLPANSTLLTPLPGYDSPAMGGAPDLDVYGSYDVYNAGSRPGSGHESFGSYDDRRRTSYSEDGRPRPVHPGFGVQGSNYPRH